MSSTDRDAAAALDARTAFEQLGTMVLRDHSMETVLQRVADLAKRVVPGVAEASVSLFTDKGGTTVVFTGALAKDLDESQYAYEHGPCMAAALGGEVVEVVDAREDTRWPDYLADAVEHGSLSSMSVPVPVQTQVNAGLNLYATEAHAFDHDSRELAQTFASYAGVAVANMYLYDSTKQLAAQLETAMRSRAVIDQAKGILMGQRRCTAEAAFQILVDLSQHSQRKLRDVAQAVVDSAVS